jgi:hypothetical protein
VAERSEEAVEEEGAFFRKTGDGERQFPVFIGERGADPCGARRNEGLFKLLFEG